MSDMDDFDQAGDEAALVTAGAELRQQARVITAAEVHAGVWRRRARGMGVLAAGSLVVVAVLAGLLVSAGTDGSADLAGGRGGVPAPRDVDGLLASLGDRPVDPTSVQLVAAVSTFDSCEALIADLRRVGAQHVGSRGFGDLGGGIGPFYATGDGAGDESMSFTGDAASDPATTLGAIDAATLGTNVQVVGVDEPDLVKAEGNLIFDLDRRGDLRITDASSLSVVSTLDVTAGVSGGNNESARVDEMLVEGSRVVLFGVEVEIVDPPGDDPSATSSSREYLTVTFVDAADPAAPQVTDRVRVEGRLVAARLVGDEIRMVTTSNMADLGFVVPTTPASVPKALEMNRRSVALSIAADWIPEWQRDGGEPKPLVPCERVYVPDTFAGVAMTSMVTVGLQGGLFEPLGTSILAPATTLYAGVEVVAVSAEVWVDPIDRGRLEFDDWRTAIHEFRFFDASAPGYEGSGIVDGSTIGQFAFGEVGGSVAVVTATGSPWQQDPAGGVDLTVLTPDGSGGLATTATVTDIADGAAQVTAVRYLGDRVLVSTASSMSGLGPFPDGNLEQRLVVIDVSDPSAPRRTGTLTVPGTVHYLHPLPDNQALAIGVRADTVGEGDDQQLRTWVVARLVDVGSDSPPSVVAEWERPWSSDMLAGDHRGFTWWADRGLAMWGLTTTGPGFDTVELENVAAVLGVADGIDPVAVPLVSPPPEAPPPCPVFEPTNPEWLRFNNADVVLRCAPGVVDADPGRGDLYGSFSGVDWPRYQCYPLSAYEVVGSDPARSAVAEADDVYVACSRRPNPTVSRVLVVAGVPILYTDQTLESLDPSTFASTAVVYHPSGRYW